MQVFKFMQSSVIHISHLQMDGRKWLQNFKSLKSYNDSNSYTHLKTKTLASEINCKIEF
jgi:spore maturation protein CgeB